MNPIYSQTPAGWNRSRLRFCALDSKNGAWGGEPGTDEVDAVCIRVADFDWEHLSLRPDDRTIRSFSKKQLEKLRLRRGDILLEKSGGGETTPVGRVVQYDGDSEAVTSNFVARVRPAGNVTSEFLLYLLAGLYQSGFSHQFIKQNTGIQNLDDSALLSSEVFLPSLGVQKSITAFLGRETARIDHLIAKREVFLALIEEKESALAARAVNGAIVDGVANGAQGWFGVLPPDWPVRRAKFLFRERQERSGSGGEELLTVSHITGVTRRSDKDVNMFLAESTEGYKLVSPGDVVVNTMWAWMGAMGVSFLNGLTSPSYGVYRPITDDFDPKYLDLLLRSRPFITEVNRRSKGVWSSRLRLYPDAFLDIRFPVPPKDAQRTILNALEKALSTERRLVDLCRRSLDRLREFRAALITAAVSGQIDVKSWRKSGQTDRQIQRVEQQEARA